MSQAEPFKTSSEERAADDRQAKADKLAPFRERKMSKSERQRLIHQKFPSIDTLNWENAFHNDIDLFARMMRDIIKLDQREPGKSGPRPNNMDYDKGLASFRRLMGEDYSVLPFSEALRVLGQGYSLTQIARKVHLSRTKVHRLIRGVDVPSENDMRAVADGFDKHPSYFLEYRRTYIIDHLSKALLGAPETTISFYTKILKAR